MTNTYRPAVFLYHGYEVRSFQEHGGCDCGSTGQNYNVLRIEQRTSGVRKSFIAWRVCAGCLEEVTA